MPRSAESHAEYMRKWRAAHPENREYQRAYHERYRQDPAVAEKARARAREWYRDNCDLAKANSRSRHHATKILRGRAKGERNPNWKGAGVGYHALHAWLARERGKPAKC